MLLSKQLKSQQAKIQPRTRNSIFEIGRIIALSMVFVGHWNSYVHLIAEETYWWFSWFAVIMFSLLTGYFYFNSPKLQFAERTVFGKKIIVSQNLVFRRAGSRIIFWMILGNTIAIVFPRIIFWMILGNTIAIVFHSTWLHYKGIAYAFVDDNWYIYSLLIVAIVGAIAQKIYFSTNRDFIFYVLTIVGMLMVIIGIYIFDFDYQFRLWRQGMMIMNLGVGWLIAKSKIKTKVYLSVSLFILSILLLALRLAKLNPSSLFPNGSSDGAYTLFIFTSSTFVFCIMSFFTIRSNFINRFQAVFQWILETHWVAILVMRGIFAHDIQVHNTEMLGLGFLIGWIMAIIFAFPVYYLKVFTWDKYFEKYLFIPLEYANILPRVAFSHYNKFFEKLNRSFEDAYLINANAKSQVKVSVKQ